jgi:hypothetical protein
MIPFQGIPNQKIEKVNIRGSIVKMCILRPFQSSYMRFQWILMWHLPTCIFMEDTPGRRKLLSLRPVFVAMAGCIE